MGCCYCQNIIVSQGCSNVQQNPENLISKETEDIIIVKSFTLSKPRQYHKNLTMTSNDSKKENIKFLTYKKNFRGLSCKNNPIFNKLYSRKQTHSSVKNQ